MSVQEISAAQALARLGEFSAIIDARSPSEFAHDRLPGAVNWPSLDDEQRARVGTMFKQVGAFEARKLGAGLTAANIARHIEQHVQALPKHWRPLVYCWRGGQRSGALALVLGQIGFHVQRIEGGYKAFRQAMLADLPQQAARLRYRVLCGPTGSGKTRLLQALAAQGAQVLDLEALASHRASVLGLIPGQPQPSQKQFEMRVWQALRGFDAARPVYVEAESKKVGNCTLPDALMQSMRASDCLHVQLAEHERVALLLEDYPFFVQDPEFFCRRLQTLTALRGRATVEAWQAQVRAGQTEAVVRALLAQHYDPGYERSTRRNFTRFDSAQAVALPQRSPAALAAAGAAILASEA
ncbi:tRNA 2-selenouridine(34) synthase MnmH [Vandammella animalimorsus]|uniref:tRNA 2-selenouridine(34) synthase MnmH n=1 Tax=Vandammella animalimorsus TaxID=2029117 RepID=A0A2A2AUI3_9BURK|nr:tRNA 2-selenouridine(34) synthase MnmH [Vandammella animalimorsus]PAT41354.1 tRNA 2-selenouridine(34) synthase MnmH [Vandammella animalimorsus]